MTMKSEILHHLPGTSLRRVSSRMLSLLTASLLACMLCPQGWGEQAVSADNVVDSAGVNVHLNWLGTTYYTRFPGVLAALKALGVRHVRDELSDLGTDTTGFYYARHDQLAAAGISSIFTVNIGESAAVLLNYPNLVKDFAGYEGPNEYNGSGDPEWAAHLMAYQQFLYLTVKGNPATAKWPVIGPSVGDPSCWPALQGLRPYMDTANLHNYYEGDNPGSPNEGSIDGAVAAMQEGMGPGPYITTETGYIYQTFMHITKPVGGIYMPRALLEQYLHGIHSTYIYELVDKDATEYGLLTANLVPRPAYTGVANLLHMLNDPGPQFTPASADLMISGASSAVHHLLMQKRDGVFYLALWIESQDYDQVHQLAMHVPDQAVTLSIDGLSTKPTIYQFTQTGNYTTKTAAEKSDLKLTLSPAVTIVAFKAQD
jgi:hypothetical protein